MERRVRKVIILNMGIYVNFEFFFKGGVKKKLEVYLEAPFIITPFRDTNLPKHPLLGIISRID